MKMPCIFIPLGCSRLIKVIHPLSTHEHESSWMATMEVALRRCSHAMEPLQSDKKAQNATFGCNGCTMHWQFI